MATGELSDADVFGAPKAVGNTGELSDADVFGDPVSALPKPQPDSPTMDAAKSFGGGLERGAAATAMVIPNLINQAVAGPQMLGRAMADGVSEQVTGMKAEPRGELWKPFYDSEDVLKSLPKPLQPHEAQTAQGVGADIVGQLAGGIVGGKAIQKAGDMATGAVTPKPETPAASDVRALASQAYAYAEAKGGNIAANHTNDWLDSASKQLPQSGKVRATLGETPVSKFIDNAESQFRNSPMGFKEAQELDSAIGELMQSHVDPRTGMLNADGNKLLKIQQSLRDTIDNSGSPGGADLTQARQLWATSARMNDIERIMNSAQYTDNPATAIKAGFRTLAKNPSRLRGYSEEEVAAIQHAAKTGAVTGALKFLGSRIIGGITGAAGGAAGGGIVGAGIGAAAGGAMGAPFRAGATALQARRGNAVLDQLANRPAVQSAMGIQPTAPASNPSVMPAVSSAILNNSTQLPEQPIQPPIQETQPPAIDPQVPQSSLDPGLQKEEGQRTKSYTDTTGHKTIGIGFNMDDKSARGRWTKAGIQTPFDAAYSGKAEITPEDAKRLAMADQLMAQSDAKKQVSNYDTLAPNQQKALMQMAYQLGGNRLAKFRPTLDLIEQGNFQDAAARLLKSKYAQQTPERVKRLAKMLTSNT